jgi:hypothetical protein
MPPTSQLNASFTTSEAMISKHPHEPYSSRAPNLAIATSKRAQPQRSNVLLQTQALRKANIGM